MTRSEEHKDRLARVRSRRKELAQRTGKARRTPLRRPIKPTPTPQEPQEAPGRVRLQKFLADAGIASRRHCEELIAAGRIEVDGQVVSTLGAAVDPTTQIVRFDGETVRPEAKVYWWVYKPSGVLCTSDDAHGRRTVLDLIPSLKSRVYAVGRLDLEATGLLLLTNDGPLAYRLTHPRFGVAQGFEVLVAGRVSNEALTQLRRGVWLSEGKFRPRSLRILGVQGNATVLSVLTGEGGCQLLRRSLAKLGHKALKLERVSIGPIKIRQLRIGQARLATGAEIQMLRELPRLPESPAAREPRVDRESTPRERDASRRATDRRPPRGAKPRRPEGKLRGPKLPKGKIRRRP